MNRYRTHVLIAISILTTIITLPTYASIVSEEACPDCDSSMTLEEIQQMRLRDVPVRMWTDKSIYQYGSSINVQGVVASIKEGMPVTVKVTSPTGNVVNIAQVNVENDRTFQAMLSTAGDLWKQNGLYTLRVQYGPQGINDKVLVELVGGTVQEAATCSANELIVRSSTNSYCVQFLSEGVTVTKATVSASSFSIALNVKADSDGTLTLDIPRSVLDSKSSQGDSPFIVLIDDDEGYSFEIKSSSTTRTLEIMVPEGASKIEIIGTFAVPEFGTMAAIILAVAIISIIVVSARSRLIMPKY